MSKKLRVMMFVGKDDSSSMMYHALKDEFEVVKVIMEDAVSKKKMILNRVKRLGITKVFGQILFILYSKVSAKFSRSRIEEIKQRYGLNDKMIDKEKLLHVCSINDIKVIELLQDIDPDVIVVNGTRIISEKILNAIDKPFLNTHAGITPAYRGVHGGYWALANNDAEHCGVTVHLVDRGIDTGDILFQANIDITEEDNFNTYPYLQLTRAIPLMIQALKNVEVDDLKATKVDLPSALWYHPTLWAYISNYLRWRVK